MTFFIIENVLTHLLASDRPNSVSAECSAEYLVSVPVSVKATETEFQLTIFFWENIFFSENKYIYSWENIELLSENFQDVLRLH